MHSADEANGEAGLHDAEDSNANVSDTSRGAIPKKGKASTSSKKVAVSTAKAKKLNNNIENMSTLNSATVVAVEEAAKLPNGLPTLNNGFLNELPSCSSHPECCKFDHDVDTEPESDADTELLSVSEDGCIYTYKGDHIADLPSSFFDIPPEIELPEPQAPEVNHVDNRQDASSPEMDYLEMDFDPSNNGDADSASEIEDIHDIHMDEDVNNGANELNQEVNDLCIPSTSSEAQAIVNVEELSLQDVEEATNNVERWVEDNATAIPQVQTSTEEKMPWSCTLAQRTRCLHLGHTKRVHATRGEYVSSPSDAGSPASPKPTAYVPPHQEVPSGSGDAIEPAMIWPHEEAHLKQITRIGPSACGATAVLNVLNALRFPLPALDKLRECVATRLRDNDAPLARYLVSRSSAGATHKDLIDGLHRLSNGTIYARFFHMYPERVVNLYTWLAFWIGNGAVPIATLNLQRCVGATVPDAWHHQMIYGVDAHGIYLTNPLEHVTDSLLWAQLCSESVLLVRRRDVLARWNFATDLPDLMRIDDVRWQRMNVVGQVANLVHENNRELRPGFTNTSHIRIPAAYSSGITLAASVQSPAYALLKQSPELPLLEAHVALDPAASN